MNYHKERTDYLRGYGFSPVSDEQRIILERRVVK